MAPITRKKTFSFWFLTAFLHVFYFQILSEQPFLVHLNLLTWLLKETNYKHYRKLSRQHLYVPVRKLLTSWNYSGSSLHTRIYSKLLPRWSTQRLFSKSLLLTSTHTHAASLNMSDHMTDTSLSKRDLLSHPATGISFNRVY